METFTNKKYTVKGILWQRHHGRDRAENGEENRIFWWELMEQNIAERTPKKQQTPTIE